MKLRCWPRAFTLYKAFFKNKNIPVTSLPALIFTWFLKRNIPQSYSFNLPNFIIWLPLILETFGNIVITCLPVYKLISFEINLSFQKGFLDIIKSIFHHFLKALIDENQANFFEKWEPDFKTVNYFFKITSIIDVRLDF